MLSWTRSVAELEGRLKQVQQRWKALLGPVNVQDTMARLTSTVAQIMMDAISEGISGDEGSNLSDSTRTTIDATHTLKQSAVVPSRSDR